MRQFNKVKVTTPKSSLHDLSHEHKTTINMGDLVPVLCQEVIPGDNFRVSYEAILKLQATIAPVMHRINTDVHFFFVPTRLVYDDYEDFFTGGKTGELVPNFPRIGGLFSDMEQFDVGLNSLADYMGLPVERFQALIATHPEYVAPAISLLPFRAYQLICSEWYLNKNLGTEYTNKKDSLDLNWGTTAHEADILELFTLRKRMWERDRFTSLLPTAQRGDPVMLPAGTVNVTGRPRFSTNPALDNGSFASADLFTDANGYTSNDGGGIEAHITSGLTADLSGVSMEDLREANMLQRFLERMSAIGYKYYDYVKGIFGRTIPDARIQVPEYLGGGRLPIQFAEVVQTSQSDTTPQGNLAGHGVAAGYMAGFKKSFVEHGYIIAILSVVPRTAYYQGVPKIFLKNDRFDFFNPFFAHLGEQEVLKREVFVDVIHDDEVIGYEPIYNDYRVNTDRVSGDFRSSLNYWHLARKFDASPALNEAFVTCTPDTRIFAVEDPKYKKLVLMGYFKIDAIRPVPKFGNPI